MPTISSPNRRGKTITRPSIAYSVVFILGGLAMIATGIMGYLAGIGFVIEGFIPVNGLMLAGLGVLLIAYGIYRIVKAVKIDARIKAGELSYE